MPLSTFALNAKGGRDEEDPPHMLLAFLIYGYANGLFSARRIQRSTSRHLAARDLTGNSHPDPGTLCTFRRNHQEANAAAFGQARELARKCRNGQRFVLGF